MPLSRSGRKFASEWLRKCSKVTHQCFKNLLLQGPKFGLFYFSFRPYFQDRFPALTSARIPRPLTVNPKVAFLIIFRGPRFLYEKYYFLVRGKEAWRPRKWICTCRWMRSVLDPTFSRPTPSLWRLRKEISHVQNLSQKWASFQDRFPVHVSNTTQEEGPGKGTVFWDRLLGQIRNKKPA